MIFIFSQEAACRRDAPNPPEKTETDEELPPDDDSPRDENPPPGDGSENIPEWAAMSLDGAPSARDGFLMVSGKDRILVVGGHDGRNAFTNGGVFFPADNRWEELSLPLGLGARYGAGGDVLLQDGREVALIWGGSRHVGIKRESEKYVDGGLYDLASGEWKILLEDPDGASARDGHCLVAAGEGFFIWGGLSNGTYLDDGARLDAKTLAWRKIVRSSSGSGPTARSMAQCFYDKARGRVLLFGGFNISGPLGDLWSFDLGSDSWERLDENDDDIRHAPTVGFSGGTLFVFGGSRGELQRSGRLIDVSTLGEKIVAWGEETPYASLSANNRAGFDGHGWIIPVRLSAASLETTVSLGRLIATGEPRWENLGDRLNLKAELIGRGVGATDTHVVLWGGLSLSGSPTNLGTTFHRFK